MKRACFYPKANKHELEQRKNPRSENNYMRVSSDNLKTNYLQVKYLFLFLALFGCTSIKNGKSPVDYVDPLIGTAPSTTISAKMHGAGTENNAQVVPYVTVPFGMTNWTPQTRDTEKKCLAPYYYTDSLIQGFRGSHWLSGSCVQDYGSFTIMPVSGYLKCLPSERASSFSHDKEKATPYFYKVHLNNYNIETEITATKRAGLFRFTFLDGDQAHIIVNPNSDEGEGFISIIPEDNEIIGYNPVHRIYQGWGEKAGFSGYFVIRFSHDFEKFGTYQDSTVFHSQNQIENLKNIGAYVSFHLHKNEAVYATVGTSFTSIGQARKNLIAETQYQDFESIKNQLKTTWENTLGKIQVKGESEEDKIKFYTAMYHSFLQPRTFNDCDGTYLSFSGGSKILNLGAKDYFTDFSMWDTFRASHPLFNLLMPEANAGMMESFFKMAEQGGWLPIFPCWNSYTSAMIGDHAIVSIADAYAKNIIDLDETQYNYLLQNAFKSPNTEQEYKEGKGRRALKSYLEYGYIPLEDGVNESFHKNEQVSRTLEYAFDDFALSRIAEKRGDSINARKLKERALNYTNVFSQKDSCVRGRFSDGTFTDDFNKYTRMSYITEGTPYQYTWFVPHDQAGLIKLMGGDKGYNENLDRFHAKGQYWHGNEPGHQIPFLYNYSGQPWKTQKLVSEIMKNEYGSDAGGLSGNDDAGQMSAWYVFAALGFYPVCPSVPEYVISGPHFDKITIQFENGKSLTILANGASTGNMYIQGMKWNGKSSDKNFLNHEEILKGGTIEFEMGNQPNMQWGIANKSRPFSLSR